LLNFYRDSLEDLKQLLQRNKDVFVTTAERTRSLRESTPTMNVPNSIYGGDERERSIHSTAISVAAASEIEFDFDDQIVNARVYRRMLAQAVTKTMASDVEAIEGDSVNDSAEPPFSRDISLEGNVSIEVGPSSSLADSQRLFSPPPADSPRHSSVTPTTALTPDVATTKETGIQKEETSAASLQGLVISQGRECAS